MTNSQIVSSTLSTSGPMCDDCVATFSNISPRQTVNAECRLLESQGTLKRTKGACPRCHREKIINAVFGTSATANVSSEEAPLEPSGQDAGGPWYWEGHIQDSLVTWLVEAGWRIDKVANTATREAGTDIVAIRREELLWVSVKGWP